MRPLSSHWADQAAARIIAQRGPKQSFVLASGITPSGVVHIGNFREVITVELVARALRDLEQNVRFIYSWDDFDTFRKVPKNLPQQEMLAQHLRKPIVRVPDPFGKQESYARSNEARFEDEISQIGMNPEFIYQSKRYSRGDYAAQIREALENRMAIKKILDQHRTEPLSDDWMPTTIFCEKCDRDEMEYERYDGEWNYSYRCQSCQHETTTDIRKTHNLKLAWRVDWPMRWAFEKVDFEPGGKDHSSQGGSYDTAKEIVKKIWAHEPPVYLQYDFVSIKGGSGKMSSSSGELISLSDAYQVYSPQMVRWIFANQRTNHDFALAFDEDVIKTYEEFDRAEAQAYMATDYNEPKVGIIKRTYEFSLLEQPQKGVLPSPVFRAPFRVLCNRLQICDGDINRTIERYYQKEVHSAADRHSFVERAERALYWLSHYAPDEFRYELCTKRSDIEMSQDQQAAVAALRELVEQHDFDAIDPKDLNQKIYDNVIRTTQVDPKDFFRVVYQCLIARDQGPRLPSFLKEIGRDRLLQLL